MQLPQHIIDIIGNLFDEGMDDETICRAVIKEWRKRMESPRRNALELVYKSFDAVEDNVEGIQTIIAG